MQQNFQILHSDRSFITIISSEHIQSASQKLLHWSNIIILRISTLRSVLSPSLFRHWTQCLYHCQKHPWTAV